MSVFVLNDHRAIVTARDGFFLINRNDYYVGKALETYGEYGHMEAVTLQSLLSEGDIVIEVGANIGSHTVGLAKKVGPHGRVYAYEPQRACYALLQSQIALNQLNQVIAINEGCGSEDGTLWHAPCDYEHLGNFGAVSLVSQPGEGFEPVAIRRLDDTHAGEKVRLIKIDVEGMETEVLTGARGIIRDQQPVLYVENDRPVQSRHLIKLIFEMGYRAWWHICPLFEPNNYFGEKKNIYEGVGSLNMICMPAHIQMDQNAFSGAVDLHNPDRWQMVLRKPRI